MLKLFFSGNFRCMWSQITLIYQKYYVSYTLYILSLRSRNCTLHSRKNRYLTKFIHTEYETLNNLNLNPTFASRKPLKWTEESDLSSYPAFDT